MEENKNNENEERGEDEDTRTQKIKKHFQENWKTYAISTAAFVAGAVAAAVAMSRRQTVTEIIELKVENNQCRIDVQTISKYGNVIGRPGKMVREITEGTDATKPYFTSQTRAALDAGVSNTKMSDHLAGRIQHLNGRVFARVEE